MRLIDADDFNNRMYHETFEKDSEDQKWDSGCWIRYKLFEKCLEEQPTVQPQTSMLTVKCKLDDEELAKAIEEVKKANLELIAGEPHWIPCKDYLPLFNFTDVLLLYHDKRRGCEDDYYIVQAYTIRGQWRPALRIDDSDMESLEPVAWMPLPAPYKED